LFVAFAQTSRETSVRSNDRKGLDSTCQCNTLKSAVAVGVCANGIPARIYYTESQKALDVERWQKGDSLQQIAQLFDRNHTSVQGILVRTGGIRPAHDTARDCADIGEREEISRAVGRRYSIRSMATLLGRAPSTISRESSATVPAVYRASQADQAAWDRAQRPKPCKLVQIEFGRHRGGRLQSLWSPDRLRDGSSVLTQTTSPPSVA